MRFMGTFTRSTSVRLVLFVVAISMVVAACSSSSESADVASTALDQGGSEEQPAAGGDADLEYIEETQAFKVVAEDGSVVFETTSPQIFDAKIIRDGRLDLRIDPGTFGVNAEEIRKIAADLGGYVASGETYIEEYEDGRYAVGWYTMRIPSDRFDDAIARVERLGERVSASLSSQDVTEEYVDLEGRLSYWRQQEQFYSALMDEATTVTDMIALQGQMQEVLMTIEQIEGRMRYLDSRTNFATLTVGLTEIPNGPTVVPEPTDSGPIAEAFDQAGEVLLATVAFIIVSAAVAIPIGILVLMVYGILRLFLAATRRKETISES
jgi:Domain of unknown function (DUF4349)